MASTHTSQLALLGGTPVHDRNWPRWPVATDATLRNLQEAATSGRWTVSGAYTGTAPFEQRFARAFAEYEGVPYAVPVNNGSAALTVAMEALGVGPGTEVIVPGLTWVACASAAVRAGAVPIIVDVERDSLSISASAARAAINERTRAILIVHAYCSCADLDAFAQLSAETGIPIIEDCSQSHGAEWNGRKVGTFGEIGLFSLQQTKVLTCGEGGVLVTSSPELHDRMQQLRADGRRTVEHPVVGQLDIEEVGAVHGHNYCMSELNAAVALAQLELLEPQTEQRERNGEVLAGLLSRIPGVSAFPRLPQVTRRAYYDYVIRLDPDVLGPFPVDRVVAALTAELNLFFETVDTPLNANRLYDPLLVPGIGRTEEERRQLDPRRFDLPVATALHRTCVAFLHHALLGSDDDVAAIATAVEKVVGSIDQLGAP